MSKDPERHSEGRCGGRPAGPSGVGMALEELARGWSGSAREPGRQLGM